MASQYFLIGNVVLPWVPETITYGYGSHVVTHTQIGGARTFDIMGPNPEDVIFTGKLTGPTRFTDRDALAALVGIQTTATWGEDSLDVIVLKAACTQEFSHISYTITCAVIVLPGSDNPTSVQVAANSVSQANALSVSNSVSSLLANASATLANSSLSASSALPDLSAAYAGANASLVQAQTTIAGFNPTQTGLSIASFTAGLEVYSAAVSAQAQAIQAQALIGLAINTISLGE